MPSFVEQQLLVIEPLLLLLHDPVKKWKKSLYYIHFFFFKYRPTRWQKKRVAAIIHDAYIYRQNKESRYYSCVTYSLIYSSLIFLLPVLQQIDEMMNISRLPSYWLSPKEKGICRIRWYRHSLERISHNEVQYQDRRTIHFLRKRPVTVTWQTAMHRP